MEDVRQSPDVSDKLSQLFIATPKGQVSPLYLNVHAQEGHYSSTKRTKRWTIYFALSL